MPRYYNLVLILDPSYYQNFNGTEEDARANALDDVNAALEQINLMFESPFNMDFQIVFVPAWIPDQSFGLGNPLGYTVDLKNSFSARYPCRREQLLVIHGGTGRGHAQNGVAVIPAHAGPSIVAHELGHLLGLTHAEFAPCSSDCSTNHNFMCATGDNSDLSFLGCQTDFLTNSFFTESKCASLLHNPPVMNPEDDCPQGPTLGFTSDQPLLIRGCARKRDKIMYTLTAQGGDFDIFNATIRVDFNTEAFSFVAAENTEFSVFQELPNEFHVIVGLNNTFDLMANETKTFHMILNYSPIATADTSSELWLLKLKNTAELRPTASPQFDPPMPVGYVHKSFIPATSPSIILAYDTPIIISGSYQFTNNYGYPVQVKKPAILARKGASIDIANGLELSFSPPPGVGTVIMEGCDAMWSGVNIIEGANVSFDRVRITDAHAAINLEKGTQANIENVTLDNNYVGIRLSPGAGSTGLSINNLTIDNTTPLKAAYTGQDPAPGTKSMSGIDVFDEQGITINSGDESLLTIRNLRNGIRAYNAATTIGENVFIQNIADIPSADLWKWGHGVYVENGHISVTGTKFNNCTYGVTATGATGSIQSCQILGAKWGGRLSLTNNFTVDNNVIKASDFGIGSFFQAPDYAAVSITNNFIEMDGNPNGIGISTSGAPGISNSGGTVANNFIDLRQAAAGIRLSEAKNEAVFQNHVKMNAPTEHMMGIRLESCRGLSVEDNNINGYTISEDTDQRGIYAMHLSKSNSIGCNLTNNTAYGINFAGDNRVDLRANLLYDHHNGLLLGLPVGMGNTVIGQQIHRGNRWIGTYGAEGAKHKQPLLSGQSQFFVDAGENAEFMPPLATPINWFFNESTPTLSPGCDEIPPALPPTEQGRDEAVARGDIQGGALQWVSQRRLYERVLWEGNPWQGSQDMTDFIADMQGTDMAKAAEVQTTLGAAYNADAATAGDLLGLDEDRRDALALLAQIDGQLDDPEIDPVTQASLLGQKAILVQDLTQLAIDKQNLLHGMTQQRAARLSFAGSINDAINDTEPLARAEKMANAAWISWLSAPEQPLNMATVQDVEELASLCPLEFGDAVIRARVLLQALSSSPVYYDDEILCAPLPERSGRHAFPQTVVAMISPNPNNGEFLLRWKLADATPSAMFMIFDQTGRCVKEVMLSTAEGTIPVDLSKAPGGVYFYRLENRVGKIVLK